ncbi:MAG TPA: aspartate dehydrogenase [bacterium]|nr:aspartate dehydrogenase [bacterium]
MPLSPAPGATLGLIGAGAIGRLVLQALEQRRLPYRRVVLLARSRRPDLEESLARAGGTVVYDPDSLLAARPEVVVEAAGHAAAHAYALRIVEGGCDLLLMSIGALADDALREPLEDAARRRGVTVWLPSGGVGGLDALAAARALGDLERVTHRTTKRPEGLNTAPYVVERGLLREPLEAPLVVYRGPAREAVRHFPQNVNIAAAVSLAGIGFDRTQVEVVADPAIPRSRHEIWADGRFGSFALRFENAMDPMNPRTSRLAGLSAVAALQRRGEAFRLT